MIPATAVAITPEIFMSIPDTLATSVITSERINVRCAIMIVRPISTDSSFLIFPISFENQTPISPQKIIPPSTIERKLHIPSRLDPRLIFPSRRIQRITRKNARAVPSLKILSPSKIRASLLGAPTDLKIESTATGSVAEIIPPNKRHTRKGISNPRNGKITKSIPAITAVESKSHPTARNPIENLFLKSCL